MEKERPKMDMEQMRSQGPGGLELDAKNLFCGQYLGLNVAEKFGNFEKLKPIITYEEYIQTAYIPEIVEKIMAESNQENIKKVNELVSEYNAILPRIQREKNAQLGLEILNKIDKIFNGEM